MFNKISPKKKNKVGDQSYGNFETSSSIEGAQYTKYRNDKGGGGFAAEDANVLSDRMKAKKVETVGTNNAKNGADRISNGEQIQTKYYSSGKSSVDAAFDSQTGLYRYKKQILEVPKDQYEEALARFEEKIKEGKVPHVTDPKQAKKLLRQGSVTYKQARNIAKAGNIDSLWFDLKSQSIVTTKTVGISFIIQYACNRWNGQNNKTALKISLLGSLRTGGLTLSLGIFTRQFLRTGMGRSFTVFTTSMSKQIVNSLYKTKIGKDIVHKLASAILGKEVVGAAAKSALTKSLRTNILTTAITTAAFTVPDLYRASISKRISWTQFSKNATVNVASAGAGLAGGYGGTLGGAKLGAVIGSFFAPGPGSAIGAGIGATVGLIAGGIAGGALGAQGTKLLLDQFAQDDAKKMLELVQDAITELAEDYLCTEDELDLIVKEHIEKSISIDWLRDMYAEGKTLNNKELSQKSFAYHTFEPFFTEAAHRRELVHLPTNREIKRAHRKMKLSFFLEFTKYKLFILLGIRTELKELL
ncbi:hypothetical protein [Paenibacillus sp. FSL R7-0652]|uniref:hypothetical protein n=1 Tax=Paenibacillus sp. FSL R7-0652 TaxID=2921687 RepID=UPI00315A7FB3